MLCCSILTCCPSKVQVVPVLNKPSTEGERTATYSDYSILKKEPSVTTGRDTGFRLVPVWMWLKKKVGPKQELTASPSEPYQTTTQVS